MLHEAESEGEKRAAFKYVYENTPGLKDEYAGFDEYLQKNRYNEEPTAAPAKDPGVMDYVGGFGKAIGSGLSAAVADVLPETLARVKRGGDYTGEQNATSQYIKQQAAEAKESIDPLREDISLLGLTPKDVGRSLSQIGFSIPGMAAGMGAGAAVGTGGTVGTAGLGAIPAWMAAAAAGGATGAATGYRAAKDQLVEMAMDDFITKNPQASKDEALGFRQSIENEAQKYGTAEALWEGVGQAVTAGLLRIPGGKVLEKLGVKPSIAKYAGFPVKMGLDTGVELGGEGQTQVDQSAVEYKLGLRDKPGPENFIEGAKEVWKDVLPMQMFMMGAGGLGTHVMEKAKANADAKNKAIEDDLMDRMGGSFQNTSPRLDAIIDDLRGKPAADVQAAPTGRVDDYTNLRAAPFQDITANDPAAVAGDATTSNRVNDWMAHLVQFREDQREKAPFTSPDVNDPAARAGEMTSTNDWLDTLDSVRQDPLAREWKAALEGRGQYAGQQQDEITTPMQRAIGPIENLDNTQRQDLLQVAADSVKTAGLPVPSLPAEKSAELSTVNSTAPTANPTVNPVAQATDIADVGTVRSTVQEASIVPTDGLILDKSGKPFKDKTIDKAVEQANKRGKNVEAVEIGKNAWGMREVVDTAPRNDIVQTAQNEGAANAGYERSGLERPGFDGGGVSDVNSRGQRVEGRSVEIAHSEGRDPGKYELREASDLIPSHDVNRAFLRNEAYPENVQERPYHRDRAEQQKVSRNAAHLDPNYLVSDNYDAVNGPPIITKDGVVLGGNSRTMSLQQAYAEHPEKADGYRRALEGKAKQFGFNPEDVNKLRHPVLVRVADEAMDSKTMARKARLYNQTAMQALDPKAEGVSKARMVTRETMETAANGMAMFDTLRKYLGDRRSRELVVALENDGVIEASKRNTLVDSRTGLLTDDGKKLVENVLRGNVLEDHDLIANMPDGIRNKLDRSLPALARIKARGGEWNVVDDVKQAVKRYAEFIGSGKKHLADFLGQGSLMGGAEDSQRVKTFLHALEFSTETNMAAAFSRYADAIEAAKKDEGKSALPGFEAVVANPKLVQDRLVKDLRQASGEKVKEKADLFSASTPIETPIEKVSETPGGVSDKTWTPEIEQNGREVKIRFPKDNGLSSDDVLEVLYALRGNEPSIAGVGASSSKANPDGSITLEFKSRVPAQADIERVVSRVEKAKADRLESQRKPSDSKSTKIEFNIGGKPRVATGRIQGDNVRDLNRGDRLKDSSGKEYAFWGQRHGVMEVHPVVDGKPVINRDSGVRVNIDDVAKARNQEYRSDDFFPAGKDAERSGPEKFDLTLGEKIGGSRKDTAEPLGTRSPKQKSEDPTPAWKKRYISMENIKTGKWTLYDTKKSGPMGARPISREEFNTQEEADAAIPLVAVALKHSITKSGNTYEIYRRVAKHKTVVIKDGFETESEAKRYMVEHAAEILETKTGYGEEILAKPDTVHREGIPRRDGPARGQDFLDTFGFRGAEFGEWNNQDERQEVLNHAYDALADLADVLNLPAKALSLNGELAIAFGARGHGLAGAKAHYERDYAAINLTKLTGAGSTAHEWFHALDHYLSRQDGKASSEKITNKRGDTVFNASTVASNDYLSHGHLYKTQARQELLDSYNKMLKTMSTKSEKYVEDTARAESFVSSAKEGLAREIKIIRDYLDRELPYGKRGIRKATAEELARYDALADQLMSGDNLTLEYRQNPGARGKFGSARSSNDVLDGMSAIYKGVRGKAGFTADKIGYFDKLSSYVQDYAKRAKMLEDARSGTEKGKNVPTLFRQESYKMDQGRTSDYWTTPHEMAARAFSAYIEDKVGATGRSDFLVYGANNNMMEYKLFDARPFPEGAEREAINKAFDNFFETVKTKETDKGVALYSRKEVGVEGGETLKEVPDANYQETPIIQKLREGVNRREGTVLPSGTYREAHDSELQLGSDAARRIASSFGKEVVFVKAYGEGNFFEGMTLWNDAHRIFVNVNASKPYMVVVGHEIGEHLKLDMPDVYEKLRGVAKGEEQGLGKYQETLNKKVMGAGHDTLADEGSARDELINDFIADNMTEKSFWTKLAKAMPESFKDVARAVKRVVDKILKKSGYQSESRQYFRDVIRVRKAVESALLEYREGLNKEMPGDAALLAEADRLKMEGASYSRTAAAQHDDDRISWTPKGKPGIFSKEGLTKFAGDAYQQFIDSADPIIALATKIDKALGARMREEFSRSRGSAGPLDMLLGRHKKDTGLRTYWKDDATQKIADSKNFREVIADIKSDEEGRDWNRWIIAMRELALAKFRPEVLEADYKAARKHFKKMLDSATTGDERRTVRQALKDLKEVRDRGVKGVDAVRAQKELDRLQGIYGDAGMKKFERISKDFRQWHHDAILKPSMEAGIISKEFYNKIKAAPESEWYAPYQREMEDREVQTIGSKEVIKRLKGSNRKIIPVEQSSIAMAQRAVDLINKNRVNKKATDLRFLSPDLADVIKLKDQVDPRTVRPSDHVVVYDNGVKLYFDMPNNLKIALEGMPYKEASILHEVMKAPAGWLRAGATLTTEFATRNFVRDQFTAYINSKHGFIPFYDSIKGLWHHLKNDDMAQEWRAAGGEHAYFTSLDRGKKEIEAGTLTSYGKPTFSLNPIELLRNFSDFTEKGTRIGVYARARQRGVSTMEAAHESRDVVVDFSRAGTTGRALNQVIAFWNANVQDIDKLSRSFKERPGQTALKMALGITLPSVLLALAHGDDPEYQALPDWDKNMFWHIAKGSDGTWFKIPKPFGPGIMAGSIPERIIEQQYSKDPKLVSKVLLELGGSVNPLKLPTVMMPIIESITGYSFFRNQPIENEGDKRIQPGYRASSATPEIYRDLGKMTDISPKMIANFVRGWTGTLGSVSVDLADVAYKGLKGKDNVEAPAKKWNERPLVKAFTSGEAIGSKGVDLDRFYDYKEEAVQAKGTFNAMVKKGDKEGAKAFIEENRSKAAMAMMMEATSRDIGKLRQAQLRVKENTALDADTKRTKLDELDRKMTMAARRANKAWREKTARR